MVIAHFKTSKALLWMKRILTLRFTLSFRPCTVCEVLQLRSGRRLTFNVQRLTCAQGLHAGNTQCWTFATTFVTTFGYTVGRSVMLTDTLFGLLPTVCDFHRAQKHIFDVGSAIAIEHDGNESLGSFGCDVFCLLHRLRRFRMRCPFCALWRECSKGCQVP
jgi:hypothetical protein